MIAPANAAYWSSLRKEGEDFKLDRKLAKLKPKNSEWVNEETNTRPVTDAGDQPCCESG